jgi:branched-chain amino acid transport system substrate-binding protein
MKNQKIRTVVAFLIVLTTGLVLFTGCSRKPHDKESVRIGAVLPLTGGLAFLGEPGKNAITMLSDELKNEKVEIKLYDSKADPKEGVGAFRKAHDLDNIKLFLTTLTGVSQAIRPMAQDTGVFQGIIAIDPTLASGYSNALQLCYNAKDESVAILDYIKSEKPSSVFIFSSRDPITQLEVSKFIMPDLKKLNIETTVEEFDVGSTQFGDIVAKFAASKAPVAVLLGYGSDFQNILKKIAEAGLMDKATYIGGVGYLEMPDYVKYNLVRTSLFTAPKFLVREYETPEFAAFSDAYKAKFSKAPTYDASYTYDAVKAIVEAVKKTGSSDPAKVAQYLRDNGYKGITGTFKFADNGSLKTDIVLSKFNEKMEITKK